MEEYAKPRIGRERLSYWKIGLTTMAETRKLLSGMQLVLFLKKELNRLWNSILPEPGQPSAQLSKLLRPTECRKNAPPNAPNASPNITATAHSIQSVFFRRKIY